MVGETADRRLPLRVRGFGPGLRSAIEAATWCPDCGGQQEPTPDTVRAAQEDARAAAAIREALEGIDFLLSVAEELAEGATLGVVSEARTLALGTLARADALAATLQEDL